MIGPGTEKQDSNTTIKCFKLLREQQFFKEIDKKDYIIWTDCGNHFRSSMVIDYFLRELKEENISGKIFFIDYFLFKFYKYFSFLFQVNLNFFCESHGKNCRDAHFSNITQFVKQESLVRKIENSNDLIEAIKSRQTSANESRIKQG